MNVLGIESSCDETAAAVLGSTGVKSSVVYTQEVHAAFGGVVPELASRAHVEKIASVVQAALEQSGVERPDAVVTTSGPGLIGAVLVGHTFGMSMAAAWDVPYLRVNHLEGHILSPMLENPSLDFPFLSLVVSGGHTALYDCRGIGQMTVLSETVDDAAGEAWDKVARMLGLGYPGGPVVDRLAKSGDPQAIRFPRPKAAGMNMSFSGLKTAVRRYQEQDGAASQADVCASFQCAAVDVLLDRVRQGVALTGLRTLCLAGGVASNSELRRRAMALDGIKVYLPSPAFCTDNAAMIALSGRMRLLMGERESVDSPVRPGWRVS